MTTYEIESIIRNGNEYCLGGGGGGGCPYCVDVLIVAGGGSGGYCSRAGGGGGGGVKECRKYNLSSTTIPIAVGAGGTKPTMTYPSHSGCDSCFGDIKSYGGGGGGQGYTYGNHGCPGGNGGGASGASCSCEASCLGGYGKGGFGGGAGGYNSGGGGGGAGGPGGNGHSNTCVGCGRGAVGGPGYYSEIFCSNCLFGTGGNGSGRSCPKAYSGGGKAGYDATFYGGGGGGGTSCNGGAGYQGVVMLRYPTDGSYGINSSTGGDCCFTCNGYCYVEFTTVGTSTFCIVC